MSRVDALIEELTADASREVCRDCYGHYIVNGHRPEDHGLVVYLEDAIDAVLDAGLAATPPEPVGGREALLREALEQLRDHGYQPMYNGRPSCPFCRNFVDFEETHQPGCLLLGVLQASPPTGVSEMLDDQCPERCLGIVGHAGPHQTSDYEPPLRIEHAAVDARDRELRAAVEAERREPPWPQFGVPSGHEATARDAYNAALDAVLHLLSPAAD